MKYFLILVIFFFSAFTIADNRSVSANHLSAGTKFTFLKKIDFPANTSIANIASDKEKRTMCNIHLKTPYDTDKFVPESYELTLKSVDVFTNSITFYHFEDSPISIMECFSLRSSGWPLTISAFEEFISDTLQVDIPEAEPIE